MPKQLHHSEHQFTSSWRWPPEFEEWVESHASGYTVNICAGLSPIGDVRIDVRSPIEIIEDLQSDEKTDVDDFKAILTDLIPNKFLGRDISHDLNELYRADNPETHTITDYIQTPRTVRADIFSDSHALPFDTNQFDTTIADPPWKEVCDKEDLFNELTRITRPGGQIIFNAWWVPTSDLVTVETIRIRQDTDRHPTGTPNISYATVCTVHESKEIARYQSRTLTDHEFEPTPESIEDAIKTELAADMLYDDGIPPSEYDIDVVNPVDGYECPQCNSHALSPANGAGGYDVPQDDRIYECQDCKYPAIESKLKSTDRAHTEDLF